MDFFQKTGEGAGGLQQKSWKLLLVNFAQNSQRTQSFEQKSSLGISRERNILKKLRVFCDCVTMNFFVLRQIS